MATAPLYSIRDQVYLKESAAAGFLEAVRISGITASVNGWLYAVESRLPLQQTATYGDRNSLIHGAVVYYSESEFVSYCDALELAEAKAQAVLNAVQAKRAAVCPEPTA